MGFTIVQLAEFVSNSGFEELPTAAVEAAEIAVVDTIAAAIGGLETSNARDTRNGALSAFGAGDTKPWFCSEAHHPLGALLSDCAAASALDIDDGHCAAAGHPGAAIIPAVLAEAFRRAIDGRRVLAAIALGYDVSLRIAAARHFSESMSFASGRWTGFGVAAALGWLRGASSSQIAHAMAIAGQEAPKNLPQGDCMASSVKGSSPWSTVAAVVAVHRAVNGATGSIDLLDRSHVYDVAAIIDELGSRWRISETYLKPYASCRYTHPVIDAVLGLCDNIGKTEQRIDELRIQIFPEARKLPNETRPTSLEGAQFSIPYCAALAAVRGEGVFRPLRKASLVDEKVLELSDRVEVEYSEEFEGRFPECTPARVTIRVGSTSKTKYVPIPLGDPSNAMDRISIESKLRDLSVGLLSPSGVRDLLQSVDRLRIGEIDPLAKRLQSPTEVAAC